MKLYVASSWRNTDYPVVLELLREAGHDAYDFRNPRPGDRGFHWSAIDPRWDGWKARDYVEALGHSLCTEGYANDLHAMKRAEAFVLVLPAGSSAHLEAGWAVGRRLPLFVLLPSYFRPGADGELMYKLATRVCVSVPELVECLGEKYL